MLAQDQQGVFDFNGGSLMFEAQEAKTHSKGDLEKRFQKKGDPPLGRFLVQHCAVSIWVSLSEKGSLAIAASRAVTTLRTPHTHK